MTTSPTDTTIAAITVRSPGHPVRGQATRAAVAAGTTIATRGAINGTREAIDTVSAPATGTTIAALPGDTIGPGSGLATATRATGATDTGVTTGATSATGLPIDRGIAVTETITARRPRRAIRTTAGVTPETTKTL
ncbi:hypothetical protein, partial [Mycobacterium sp. UM_WGJ]|uniref:hypothetical protein n=1 Tax=Mycobacterium sp. UM_WGJ TaxID=1370120 RepID=UPI00350F780C